MNDEKELKRIVLMISEKDVSPDDITDKTVLTKDLGYNSVKIIALIVEIESFFKFSIEDDCLDLEELIVFGSLKKIVEKSSVNADV